MSLKAMGQIVGYSATLPGRKLILWVSPGWPMYSGPGLYMTSGEENSIFSNVVQFSTEMLDHHIALYNINPAGVGGSVEAEGYYQSFLGGLTKPSDAQFGNLSLPVLAVNSGGVVIESSSDVADNLENCLKDARSWYEISFAPLPSEHANQYHRIAVKVDRAGVTARTSDEFYANPHATPLAR
jgi:VWFA-related protein